jgi:hypothetical protein
MESMSASVVNWMIWAFKINTKNQSKSLVSRN